MTESYSSLTNNLMVESLLWLAESIPILIPGFGPGTFGQRNSSVKSTLPGLIVKSKPSKQLEKVKATIDISRKLNISLRNCGRVPVFFDALFMAIFFKLIRATIQMYMARHRFHIRSMQTGFISSLVFTKIPMADGSICD